ncbi:MAG: replication-relaxation family protein, partial [Actinomycetota bacterium]
AILVELARRKLLTTEHIHSLFFRSLRRAQAKVQELRGVGLIETLPARARGRRPNRHHLTALGARVAALHLGRAASKLSLPARDAGLWRLLAHRLGVNDFFCGLALACDRHPGYGLHAWEDEPQIAGGGQRVQADAFGRLLHPGHAVEFLLEYDRGTEHFWPVVRKLGSYLTVASAHSPEEPVPFPSVLFLVGGEAREAMVRRAFGVALEQCWDLRRARSGRVPLYVSNRALLRAEGSLGALWQPFAGPDGRLRLAELPSTPECWWEVAECFRIRWLEAEGAA